MAGLPPDLSRVIDRLLEKEVAMRYASADEALNDLKNLPLLAVDLPAEPRKRPIVETDGGKSPPLPPIKNNVPIGCYVVPIACVVFILFIAPRNLSCHRVR